MTTPTQPSQLDALSQIVAAVIAGLPAPDKIEFRGSWLGVHFDAVEARDLWAPVFGIDLTDEGYRVAQPFPLEPVPDADSEWVTSAITREAWRGWRVTVNTTSPITAEQRRGWIESVLAEQAQAYLAVKAGERS